MKAARVFCRFLRPLFPFVLLIILLIFILLFMPIGFSGRAEVISADGPHLEISSIRGNLEDGRPSSIFVVLKNNASPSEDPVEPGFDQNSARSILAELESSDERIRIFSGQQNAGLLAAGENRAVQFMALADGAALGIYPMLLHLNYSRLSQVTVSGAKNAPNFVFVYERSSQELPIQAKVVLGPRIEQEELVGNAIAGGQSGLRVALANRGDLPAFDIQMQARPIAPFLMVENDQVNVSLSPGESATLTLSVFTEENATSGCYALPCQISYRYGQDGEISKQDLALLVDVGEESSFSWLHLGLAGLALLLLAGGLFGLRRFMSSQRRIRIVKN